MKPEFNPRVRIPHRGLYAFGPGRADLLDQIVRTGSIRKAASRMEMSYQRAWTLTREMNRLFREPLVTVTRGGETGGGARLTKIGTLVLSRYRHMERVCKAAAQPDWTALVKLLRR